MEMNSSLNGHKRNFMFEGEEKKTDYNKRMKTSLL